MADKGKVVYGWDAIEIATNGRRSSVKRLTFSQQRDSLRRLTKRTPEVMVKVSGGGKTTQHVMAHLTYISRNGKLEAIDEQGDKLSSKDDMTDLLKEWGTDIAKGVGKNKLVFNVVLSMPAGTDAHSLHKAAQEFAKSQFLGERQYLMVLHEPETDPSKTKAEHPHVHLVIKAAGYDGKRLYIRKATLEKWRGVFAEKLRDQGIEANATPRELRGVTKKHKKLGLQFAERRGASRVWAKGMNEAKDHLNAGKPIDDTNTPWGKKIAEKRELIVTSLRSVADEYQKNGDIKLAEDLRQFAAELPQVETANAERAIKLRDAIAEKRLRNDRPGATPRVIKKPSRGKDAEKGDDFDR